MPAIYLLVELLAITPNAEALIYSAARQCTSSDDAVDIFERAALNDGHGYTIKDTISGDDQKKLIRKVIDSGHTSILECVSFSFAISGISRACSHQLVRHRIASYSQQSQRYVKIDDFDFVMPPSIEKNRLLRADYVKHMMESELTYQHLVNSGVPPEDARFVLPNACATKLVTTMNCRALLHFFEERACNRAQWEIRALAKAMLAICKDKLPVVFASAGPKCKRLGRCPEAKPCTPHLEQMAKGGGATCVA